jgi:CBS domain-containing protein
MDIASILATKGGPLITGDLVGIVTERHIVREVARTQRVLTQTVGEIMTRDVVRAQRDTYRGAVDILETRILGEAP